MTITVVVSFGLAATAVVAAWADLFPDPVATAVLPTDPADRHQRPLASEAHGHQHSLELLDERLDAGNVEHVGAELDTEVQFAARPVLLTVSG